MKKFDVSILTVAVLLTGLAVIGVSQAKDSAALDTNAVAKIGDVSISQHELYEQMKKESGASVMSDLVAIELCRQEGAAQGITVSEQEVDAKVNPIKDKLKTPEKFQQYLKEKNFTNEKELRERIKMILLRDKLLEKAYPVTDEQIKEYYEKNKEKLGKSLEEARPEIAEKLQERNKRKNVDEWITQLKKKYNVQISDPVLIEPEQE
ncbi:MULTISPECIES: peptidylprolyl isomerase [Brevibacillus]|uniref:peptidylprolyl isomerase n=1 Tax=Brevibacillus TaxID=55080 RepID=UPI00156BC41C|nr:MULTISPECIES: peptidylprolyl isomerase [Brevibacillus]MBU8711830.1 SurA N-terminal domain-containing protein [Brevibacillus parabrevis]MDR5000917.1 peptidylprolyl isomerase [Brevibacillus parabrevis]UED71150.1 peptidylprolyl isomerase [Brevibacillus sp. HD3.3A]